MSSPRLMRVGAARQYSGTAGGVALCQVAVTLIYATSRGHALIGRALYLPEAHAADEEHRELAGVPEELMFAPEPQLADSLIDRAHRLGIRAALWPAMRCTAAVNCARDIRRRGMGYVMAVRANHAVTAGSGRTTTAAAAVGMIPARAWHRMRTGSGTKGTLRASRCDRLRRPLTPWPLTSTTVPFVTILTSALVSATH